MIPKLRRRLTYADVVASIALFMALGGTSYAVATGSIGSRELKDNAVRGIDVRRGSLTGSDMRDNALTGADIRNDRLTGADVSEPSLGKVPSAGVADSATRASTAGTANSAATANTANSAATANTANSAGTAGTANSATVAGTGLQTFRDESVDAPATVPGENWTLLSATIPAGSYVLVGKATIDNDDSGAVEIRCFMRVGSAILDRANLGLGVQPGDEDIGPLAMAGVHSSATSFTVVLECTNQGNAAGDTAAQDRKILAYPVAGVVSTQAAGP